jgi:hypothetical protein
MFNRIKRLSNLYPGQSDLVWVRIVLLSVLTFGVFFIVSLIISHLSANKD